MSAQSSKQARRTDWLCPRCDGLLMAQLMIRNPGVTLKQLARLATPALGFTPHEVTLSRFLAQCGIPLGVDARRRAGGLKQRKVPASIARPGASAVSLEHRRLARHASVFSLASEVDQ